MADHTKRRMIGTLCHDRYATYAACLLLRMRLRRTALVLMGATVFTAFFLPLGQRLSFMGWLEFFGWLVLIAAELWLSHVLRRRKF